MYATGINRYIIHRYAHQPWLDKVPGMTMGQWGTHFERTTTWWNQGTAWVEYLTRCQYLLQQGAFVADVCWFAGDAAPNDSRMDSALKAAGYDYDGCNADVLMNRMTVKDGRLLLPDGMSYRLLAMPETTFVTPQTLVRLRELMEQGATIVGPRPTKSPSLAGYPGCDSEVAQCAADMWGDADGKQIKEHAFGKGRVIWGKSVEEVLSGAKVEPDCEFEGGAGKMAWIHRVAQGADIYFVSNQSPRMRDVDGVFRVSGKVPELWHPETGDIERAPMWSEHDGRTRVPLHLDPSGSVFVVFRKAGGAGDVSDHFASLKRQAGGQETKPPQVEVRKAMYEAVDGAGGTDVTGKVATLVKSGQYDFAASNSNFGDPAFNHVKRLRVEFTVDGKALTRTVEENGTMELVEVPVASAPAAYSVSMLPHDATGAIELRAFQPGRYDFQTVKGKIVTADVKAPATPIEISGPWAVSFPAGLGAPAGVTLDKLMSWTEHSDSGVKYFSGTAEYQREFEISPELLGTGTSLTLDLGSVKVIAEVTLNGKDLGIWWKPPFAADISAIAKPGKNTLRVRVTNLWCNRLIGDEQLPPDVEWNGMPIKAWPTWLTDGTPRTSGRLTFTTWHHYTKDSVLVESGLIGPVLLRPGERVKVDLPKE